MGDKKACFDDQVTVFPGEFRINIKRKVEVILRVYYRMVVITNDYRATDEQIVCSDIYMYIKSQVSQETDSLLTSRFHEWRYLTKPKTQKQQLKTYDSTDLN